MSAVLLHHGPQSILSHNRIHTNCTVRQKLRRLCQPMHQRASLPCSSHLKMDTQWGTSLRGLSIFMDCFLFLLAGMLSVHQLVPDRRHAKKQRQKQTNPKHNTTKTPKPPEALQWKTCETTFTRNRWNAAWQASSGYEHIRATKLAPNLSRQIGSQTARTTKENNPTDPLIEWKSGWDNWKRSGQRQEGCIAFGRKGSAFAQ